MQVPRCCASSGGRWGPAAGCGGLCLPGAARWEQHVQSIQHRLDKCVKQPMPAGNQFAWKD